MMRDGCQSGQKPTHAAGWHVASVSFPNEDDKRCASAWWASMYMGFTR